MDFQNTFTSEGGKRTLLALRDRAKSEVVMTPLDNIGRVDIYEVASYNGKRSMITYIDSMLAKNPNIEKQTEARSTE
jgi:hypothetical protein